MIRFAIFIIAVVCSISNSFAKWNPAPQHFSGHKIANEIVSLESGKWSSAEKRPDQWAYLLAPRELENVEVKSTVTIQEPAKRFGFFGQSWSVWPDPAFGDQGFEACILLRADNQAKRGYRVQLSHKLQEVSLVRFPGGGYVRSVPVKLKLRAPIALKVIVAGNVIRVSVDGRERIRYVDDLEPSIRAGRIGLGVSSLAKATFTGTAITPVDTESSSPPPHQENLRIRQWLGGRPWILTATSPSCCCQFPKRNTSTT